MPHTPGPWTAEFGGMSGYDCMTGAWNIYAESRKRIADLDLGSYGQRSCDLSFRSAEAEANARLIAAAPELLGALKVAADGLRAAGYFEAYELAQVLIAKAEGR